MNRELMLEVADVIEREDRFRMAEFFAREGRGIIPFIGNADFLNHCGTTACLAGWACHVGHQKGLEVNFKDPFGTAQELFGITELQAESLFVPDGFEPWAHVTDDAYGASAAQGAKLLRMIAEGEIEL